MRGHSSATRAIGRWWAAVPCEHWPDSEELQRVIHRHWDPRLGGRRQEIVFIGMEMDEQTIRAALTPASPTRVQSWARQRWARAQTWRILFQSGPEE
jgi:hypothetical protein